MNYSYILIGLICLFGIGQCTLLGAKECTYGPAYWCESIRNAKECNAVKHCIQSVWEKQILPEDNDDICAICKDMVKQARDQLLSNETQEEIRQVFEGSCKLIPVVIIKDECIKVSDDFIPELIDTLASRMDPQVVCATAGLCNSLRVDRLLKQYKLEHPDAGAVAKPKDTRYCKDCTKFVSDVVIECKTHPRSVVLDHLLAVCARLSSLSDGCMALMQTHFEDIYRFLTQQMRPQDVCDLFGMCARLYGEHTVDYPKTDDEPCDFCVAIVNSWRNNLINNTTKAEFKQILDGICHETGSFKAECLSLVDQYFELLYDLLASEIQPREICEAVGLCGPNSIFKNKVSLWPLMQPQDRLPLVQLRPSIDTNELIGQDEANSYRHNIKLPRVFLSKSDVQVVSIGEKGVLKTGLKTGESCIMCEFVLHFLQNVLQDQKTRDEIKTAVDNVCDLLPHTVAEECQDYVDAYGDQLIQLIILEMDPSTICPMLKLCPEPKRRVLSSLPKTDYSCVLCEYVMTELEEILQDKKTEDEVKNAVEKVCSVIPKTVRKECKKFIDDNFDMIVDLLINGFTPRHICTQLGFCPSGPQEPASLTHVKPEEAQLPVSRHFIPDLFETYHKEVTSKNSDENLQSVGCVICEFVMSRIDSMLLLNSTEKDIEKVVDAVCMLLPSTLMKNCLGFMEEYVDSIIEMLVNQIEPDTVCRALRLCKDTFSNYMPKAQVAFPEDKCSVCKEVTGWTDKNLKTEDSTQDPQILVDHVCRQFPDNARKMCVDMVWKYGQFLQKLLIKLGNAEQVCEAIKMCPELLGAKKCTWGPSYWCQSTHHAEACKATQHCVENVWGGKMPEM